MPVSSNTERFWRGLVHSPLLSFGGLVRLAFLWPLTALYWIAVKLNSAFTTRGERLALPIISVGNLSVGGTGKTPFVGWLANELQSQGRRVGIVCSGYGRVSQAQIVDSGARLEELPVSDIGDEVALLASWLPECVFAVSASKSQAARALLDSKRVDLILVDDGFQTRELWRDMDIALLNTQAPRSEYRLLLAGTLREPKSALRRADAIVYTKLPPQSSELPEWLPETVSQYCADKSEYRSTSQPTISGATSDFDQRLTDVPALLVSAVADNASVAASAVSAGVRLADSIEFADHFQYDYQSLERIRDRVVQSGAEWILTTEKDWVKLRRITDWPVPVAVLRQRVELERADQLLAQVAAVIER